MELIEKLASQVPALVVMYLMVRSFLVSMKESANVSAAAATVGATTSIDAAKLLAAAAVKREDASSVLLERMHADCQASSRLSQEYIKANSDALQKNTDAIRDLGRTKGN